MATIEELQKKAKSLQSSLGSSTTAYAPNTAPSKSDVSLDSQLSSVNQQISDLRSKGIRNSWYGNDTTGGDNQSPPDGAVVKVLKALSLPMNAVVGTAQYALGKGTRSSLADNVNNAMKTGLSSGDVLKQLGVNNRAVQIPLGFALDVMLDPVNWATAGVGALIPRAGTGLIKGAVRDGAKGALKGVTSAIESGVERKAASAMGFVPLVRKISNVAPKVAEEGIPLSFMDKYRNTLIKGSDKFVKATDKVGERAIKSADKFDSVVGTDVYDRIGKGIGFGIAPTSQTVSNFAENTIKKVLPGEKGEKFIDFFKYSTKEADDVADLKDKITKLAKDKGVMLVRSENGAQFKTIDEGLKAMKEGTSIADKTGEVMKVAVKDADGVLTDTFKNGVKVFDNKENAISLLETAAEDYNLKHLDKVYEAVAPGKTGVKWYDNVIDKLKSTTVDDILNRRLGPGVDAVQFVEKEANQLVDTWNSYNKIKDLKPLEKILDGYSSYISLSKAAKVPMNVGSHVVANIGNFFMGAMMGLPVYKPGYYTSVKKASSLVKGKLSAKGLQEMFFNDINSMADMLDNNPTRFRQLTGIDPVEITGKINVEDRVLGAMGTSREDVLSFLKGAQSRIENEAAMAKMAAEKSRDLSKADSKILKDKMGRYSTASETAASMSDVAPLTAPELPTSFVGAEITPNKKLDKLKAWVAAEAENKPYNPAVRAADVLLNTMPRWYEHVDQSWKIGTTNYLTQIGLTEQELVTLSRTIPITKADILAPAIKNGERLYKLTPLKASEVAMEAYMNYAAMPDFVKVVRALPVVGSPFFSFPYAMAAKTAKTAIDNPAIFNKVGSLINEMNVGRTPQEKQALDEKYNEYLKSPTVVKMAGMWNTDVKNFVPYYTMNMFNPSERDYGDSIQGKMLNLSDKFPFLQDPIGQVVKDYVLTPWVLSGTGQTPQGGFGQPLYPNFDESGNPVDVGLGTKAFYAGRSAVESLVPGSLGYLGLANSLVNADPGTIDMIPSYGARNLANATQGRSSIGADTKEDAVRKSFRSILGRSGIPAYTLDPTKTSSK